MDDYTPGQLMIQEIREQPAVITRLVQSEFERIWEMTAPWHNKPPRFIFIAARGTSDHAAIYGKYLFEIMNGIATGLAAPSISSVYKARVRVEDALFIGISQSGEAADVVSVLEQAREDGAETLAITNVSDSPLANSAQQTIELHADPELAVAATKTFTSTMAVLLMLSAAMGRNESLHADIARLPDLISDVLGQEAQIRTKVERFRYLEECVILGRGYNLATAYELALKLRETCYIRAQPFASPDFVHGPIAIVEEGFPVIAFANQGLSQASVLDVIAQIQARGAEAVVFGNDHAALQLADIAFPVCPQFSMHEVITPFPSIVAGQLFAHALALIKGVDPDKPRGLHKVTITH